MSLEYQGFDPLIYLFSQFPISVSCSSEGPCLPSTSIFAVFPYSQPPDPPHSVQRSRKLQHDLIAASNLGYLTHLPVTVSCCDQNSCYPTCWYLRSATTPQWSAQQATNTTPARRAASRAAAPSTLASCQALARSRASQASRRRQTQ